HSGHRPCTPRAVAGRGGAVKAFAWRWYPQLLAAAVCLGLAAATGVRLETSLPLAVATGLAVLSAAVGGTCRFAVVAVALALLGWWWGSARLDAIDRSSLSPRLGTAGRATIVATGPARTGRFDVRQPGMVLRFADLRLREPVLMKLPRGRAPPQ